MTALDQYNLNDVMSVIGRFYVRDPLNTSMRTLTDPTTAKCYVEQPNNTVEVEYTYPSSPEISKLAVGIFMIDIPASISGPWRFRWDGDGAVEASVEGYCVVLPSKVLG